MHVLRFALILILLPLGLAAQGVDGSNRPGNWRVKVQQAFGIWSVICDERNEGGRLKQRCYIRYVDVFSPRPDFAAMFLFVTPESNGFKIDFGLEAGTLFDPNGFRIERSGDMPWGTRRPGCLIGLSCDFTGNSAGQLLQEMQTGGDFRFTFRDRHGKPQDLSWSLAGFDKAFEVFEAQSRVRGLLKG